MITLYGIHIYEFSIALSDLILFTESIILAWLLYKQSNRSVNFKTIPGLGFFLFAFLGASSLLGSLFHGFFPLKAESPGGFIVWMLTTTVIGLVAVTILYTVTYLLKNKFFSKAIHALAGIFLASYLYAIFCVDYHYPMVIKFYAPVILLFGVVGLWKFIVEKKIAWLYVLIGITLSIIAAVVQSLHISLDPEYFNFNTIYHIIQGIALIFLYFFFKKYSSLE